MDVTDRFSQLWHDWDDKVRDHSDVPGFLAGATDEDLVELLAGTSVRDRKYERDVVATEVLNRLHRRSKELPAAAEEVLHSAEVAYEAAARGQLAIHTAESILKATGDAALGAAVSSSAYASLDTTKLAFEAAQQNAADVQATVSQSRIARGLAQDAASAAQRGTEATQDATASLERSGHGAEARAAREAAADIDDAARETVTGQQPDGASKRTLKHGDDEPSP